MSWCVTLSTMLITYTNFQFPQKPIMWPDKLKLNLAEKWTVVKLEACFSFLASSLFVAVTLEESIGFLGQVVVIASQQEITLAHPFKALRGVIACYYFCTIRLFLKFNYVYWFIGFEDCIAIGCHAFVNKA